MSLLIFAGIIAGLPRGIAELVSKVQTSAWGSLTIFAILMIVIDMIAVVAFIVYVERSERRIPIQSARRIVGRRMMGGSSSHLPLKVNSGGVMPIIFASSILPANRPGAGSGHALVCVSECPGHRILRLLLCFHRDEAGRYRGQFPQVWIVHSRHPARQAHVRLLQRYSYPHHLSRCGLSDRDPDGAHIYDFGHSFRQALACRGAL